MATFHRVGLPEILHPIRSRILRYLSTHPEGLSGRQIHGWISSISKFEVSMPLCETALYELRDEGLCACANGLWFKREVIKIQLSSTYGKFGQ